MFGIKQLFCIECASLDAVFEGLYRKYAYTRNLAEQALKQCLLNIPQLELAILIGCQVNGKTHIKSDWDIAIRRHYQREIDIMIALAQTETLRRTIAKLLEVTEDKIDLIDLSTARVTMRAVVAEEGLVLKGEEILAWHYFLQRT